MLLCNKGVRDTIWSSRSDDERGEEMPRRSRQLSSSGIYHIMLRGINRQAIFEDDADGTRFLEILAEYKMVSNYRVLGYCLMGNHVHLLLLVEGEPLSTILRRIASKYVYWFNAKYDRVGHLFQERFKSEPVEDEAYLLTVLRYIHRNPIKAGLCSLPEEYGLSSYHDYMGGRGIVDTDYILAMTNRERLAEYTREETDDVCLDMEEHPRRRLTDEAARDVIERLSGCSSVAGFQQLSAESRNAVLPKILREGVSIRQASRLTGLSVGVIRRFTPGRMGE